MALLASSVSLSTPNIKVNQFQNPPPPPPHLYRLLQLNRNANRRRVSPKRGSKTTMAQLGDPNKMMMMNAQQFVAIKDKLWETTPETLKHFPWQKAENLLLQKLLMVGLKALQISLVTVFVLSCLSDVVFSISRNQELMIPIALLIGCLITDFLKETSQQHVGGMVLKWQLLAAIGSFFVLVKLVSAFFALPTQVFLLHVANGGLMQVLWLWRKTLPEQQQQEEETTSIADAEESC